MISALPDKSEIDVILLDYPDYKLREFGARRLGEIGGTGQAAPLTKVVYQAASKRIRNLPITLDKSMDGASTRSA